LGKSEDPNKACGSETKPTGYYRRESYRYLDGAVSSCPTRALVSTSKVIHTKSTKLPPRELALESGCDGYTYRTIQPQFGTTGGRKEMRDENTYVATSS
jgi:hypothetical protein